MLRIVNQVAAIGVVVAQLAEWSFPIPEDDSSNPASSNIYWNKENKEKYAGSDHF